MRIESYIAVPAVHKSNLNPDNLFIYSKYL